ncbi:bifunctional adenosylcobinamide kinase/adenosylcobinamide-phosphate guanylyltransferase [Pseudoflavonifractor phocaeensis]|uniref:bifunctional adenosylcobinamide kinase/adenosylcobinamide-phosphate guanylyltransferase n=1 Tax=Pseudoflavonifractor phocaeensis TaxID=1870988 RepID=UPI0025A40C3E|nr:bifunctional adenosylcobinamide kinase/adenosylcobinamide-phosphate guanylyltransferase [Pseudoflavonifractor phocaeensis]MDM8238823.1 bifunctional adenosylcobinamide kinase/adenosylcobinamide-phosphate guanylyltransferase [Pseudoflavonifractor phocaeensis]
MILIIGGRGAGKREFARETLGCDPKDTLPALHELDPLPPLEELLGYEAVICDEVGCGVVPMERADRERREAIGRLCCQLAKQAQAVYRLQCGLAMRLK